MTNPVVAVLGTGTMGAGMVRSLRRAGLPVRMWNRAAEKARALTDTDIARLAAYLRRTRTDRAPWVDLEKKVAAIRQDLAAR